MRGINEIKRSLLKDMCIEFRNPTTTGAAASFTAITTLAVSMVSGGIPFSPLVKAVLFWIILFFSGMNSLLHVFTKEQEEGTAMFLSLHISPENVYISKLIFNLIFFLLIELIVCPLFVFLTDTIPVHTTLFVLAALCGGIAITAASTILAAMVSKAGGRGALFTVTAFPLILPVLWVCISSTAASIGEKTVGWGNIIFLLAFSGTIIALSLLLFRYVWLEK